MCPESVNFLASDKLYAGILHFLTCIEIPLHTFGAYLIVMKTPKEMKMVKTSILLLHLVGASVDIFMSFLTTPVLNLPACSGYPLGFSLLLGIPTSVLVYVGISSVGVIGVTVLSFFENRYHQLINRASGGRSWKRILYVLFHYVLSATFIAPSFLNIPSEDQGKVHTFEKIPCIPTDVPYRHGYLVLATDSLIVCLCISVMLLFVGVQWAFFAGSIFRYLSHTVSHSQTTTRLQRQFFIAMCIQLIIPLAVVFFPAAFVVFAIRYDYFNQAANNIAMAAIATHGVFTTLTMIIVHKPYQQATLSMLRGKSE